MLVQKISFVRLDLREKITDIEDYNLDVFVELENRYPYTVVVGTSKNLISLMDKEKMNFLESVDPFIIVRKMIKSCFELHESVVNWISFNLPSSGSRELIAKYFFEKFNK